MKDSLIPSCSDILHKNMWYTGTETLYLLYDTESPLARTLSNAWISVLEQARWVYPSCPIITREFENPPQPLYRGGLINPENPHTEKQNRIITSHNITENINLGLDHHKKIDVTSEEISDSQIESIKESLISLPKWSIVILVQSTNFRLSTFRIRLELFHRWIHVVEFNHLAYIKDKEIDTFEKSLLYRTDRYIEMEQNFATLLDEEQRNRDQNHIAQWGYQVRVQSVNGDFLDFWPVENIRGNTGDYSNTENKWGTFPIGEIFTEAIDLTSVNGRCLIEAYPREDFSVEHCPPFELTIEDGRVLPSEHFPASFQKLYNWIVEYEWEVIVRELGLWLNPAITTHTPLSDINFYERKTGVHLSLGKKHGIYGKKLPKTEIQRFHIDVFVALESVYVGEKKIFDNGKWIL